MINAKYPCKDCKDRKLYCHSSCEKYQEKLKAHKSTIEVRKRENELICWYRDSIYKHKKEAHKQ